uniref:Heme NO-binding domain-containing protein n=1 Tax=Timema poppense TaxID=170557 RepID=A0A7R9DB92_TIMPO|nr:unnamed protein product [Timema poppensis]
MGRYIRWVTRDTKLFTRVVPEFSAPRNEVCGYSIPDLCSEKAPSKEMPVHLPCLYDGQKFCESFNVNWKERKANKQLAVNLSHESLFTGRAGLVCPGGMSIRKKTGFWGTREKTTMYGLLLENMSEFIKQVYGEDKWEEIRRMAQVDQPSFSVHQVYPENLIPRLAKKAIQPGIQDPNIHIRDPNAHAQVSQSHTLAVTV